MLDLNYALPNFTSNLRTNLLLIELLRSDSGMFLDGVRFDSVYGSFRRCKANGGRHQMGLQQPPERIHATFAALNGAGVKARLTFTNMFVDEQMLEDAYVRRILDIASGYDVEVIVYSDVMADFLRQNYPFKLVLSTSREITDIDVLNGALERFDYVVLNYNYNKDYDFISQVAHPERLEVIVNELCAPNCPIRQQHYEYESRFQIDGKAPKLDGVCERPREDFADLIGGPVVFSNEEIVRLRADYGVRYFKIAGRGMKREKLLDCLLYYLVKPEYHADVRRMACE